MAYDEDDYELARKDQNLTSWSNERSKYREEEIISWEDRPPKSVVSYPYGQLVLVVGPVKWGIQKADDLNVLQHNGAPGYVLSSWFYFQ